MARRRLTRKARRLLFQNAALRGGRRLAGISLLLWAYATPAAPAFTAHLDRAVVPLGESVTLSLTFEGISPKGEPPLPALPNLTVTSSGNSSEFNFVNGQSTSKITYNYTLLATRPGDVTIPAMQVQAGGKILTSEPIQLKIVPAGTPGVPGTRPEVAVTNLAFLRLVVPKTEVYLGEPFPLQIELYWQNAQDVQMPQLKADGFSLGTPAKPSQTRTQVGNTIYNLVVFRMAATAAKPGLLTLGPAECSLTVLVPVNNQPRRNQFDPFGSFFQGMQGRHMTLLTDPQTIQVLPLPAQNVPENFAGAVGTFSVAVSAGPTNLGVGDPLTVRVQISGRGQLDAVALPPQSAWREFKAYPPTSKVDSGDPLGLSGVKSFEQVVIPQNHEIKELPPFQFSYFDPALKSYRVVSTAPVPLSVHPTGVAAVPPPGLTNTNPSAEAAPAANDIVHISARLEEVRRLNPPLIQHGWFLAAQGVPVLAWASLLINRKRREALANNPRLRRQREVAQRIRAGLQELRALAAARQSEEFFATLFHLLQEQIGERLDLPASAITEAVIDELRSRQLREETVSAVHELFQICNQARYAPHKTSQELEALIPRAEPVFRELQKLKA